MPLHTWLAYVATVLVVMSTPGPSHLLMLSTSMSRGFRPALATAAGDLTANALQMLAAGFGLATLLAALPHGLALVKWAGVAYLALLGARQLAGRRTTGGAEAVAADDRRRGLWIRGFVTSAANPKAVVFFAALFPQFLGAHEGIVSRMVVLGATYLIVDAVFLCAYGLAAAWLATRLRDSTRSRAERVAGGCMLGAALLLGLKTAGGIDDS